MVDLLPKRPRISLAKEPCPVDGCGKQCSERFKPYDEKRDHAAAAHIKAKQTTWACPIEGCNMVYSAPTGYASLNSHLRFKHPLSNRSNVDPKSARLCSSLRKHNRLREQGVGPSTVVVTWHTNKSDFVALKQWLESEGEYGIFTDDRKCIPVIRYFRPNFEIAKAENGRLFPLSLPVIFPLLMTSRHYLFGRNHHATVDAQQLYFMVRVFEMMCKRPEDRPEDWLGILQRTPDPAINKFQTVLNSRKRKANSDEE